MGWESDDVAYRVKAGQLYPVFAEVYSLGGPPQTQKEWWMASVLTFGPGTRVSDSAAAELYGWIRYPLNELHVTTLTDHRPRQNLIPHCRSSSSEWRTVDHIPVTSPEQTILDCAATMKNDTLFRRIIRLAQAERATSHARLLLISARSAGVRGVSRLRTELAEGPSPTRSAGEDRVLDLLRHGGPILTNHVIDGDEVDVYIPERRAVIEVDSELHDNPAARKHDATKQRRLERKGLTVYRMR